MKKLALLTVLIFASITLKAQEKPDIALYRIGADNNPVTFEGHKLFREHMNSELKCLDTYNLNEIKVDWYHRMTGQYQYGLQSALEQIPLNTRLAVQFLYDLKHAFLTQNFNYIIEDYQIDPQEINLSKLESIHTFYISYQGYISQKNKSPLLRKGKLTFYFKWSNTKNRYLEHTDQEMIWEIAELLK